MLLLYFTLGLVASKEVVGADADGFTAFSFLLKPEFRKNTGVIDKIHNDLKPLVREGKDEYLYQSKSENLGTFFWVLETLEENGQPFWNSHKDYFEGWVDLAEKTENPSAQVAIPRRDEGKARHIQKRDITSDRHALLEMKSISQPPGVDIRTIDEYWYDSSMGEGTVIYVIDSGAQMEHADFEGVNFDDKWLWAGPRPATGDKSDGDDDLWHGTGVLGKIAGKYGGVARKAKIIIVRLPDKKMSVNAAHLADALLQTYDDILARNKESKVVVSVSQIFPKAISNDEYDKFFKTLSTEILGEFVKLKNVVFVTSAGNKRPDVPITTYPSANGEDYSELVVVTGTDGNGNLDFQTAPYVKIATIAVRVWVPTMNDDFGYKMIDGTSFATPAVAGLVAYFMGLGMSPEEARDEIYKKAWPRVPNGVPMIWNGIDFRQLNGPSPLSTSLPTPTNPGTGSSSSAPPGPTQSCHGLGNKKYLTRDLTRDKIEGEFCPDVVRQGGPDEGQSSLSRTYNKGTPEEFSISVEWRDESGFKPTSNDCIHFLRDMALDGCDGNDPENPLNWKGGASVAIEHVTYHLDPVALRQPAPKKAGGKCQSDYKALFDQVEVWGYGWSSTDSGKKLRDELDGCGVSKFKFEYGLGDDGREWTAKFRTTIWQKKCVGHAAISAGAPEGFTCKGSG